MFTRIHRKDDPEARSRYVRDVLALHDTLSFRNLVRELDGQEIPHLAVRPDGLTTFALRTEQVPHRYLLGLQAFRLTQYLQIGYASEQITYAHSLFCEPPHQLHPQDLHVIALNQHTGRILGYVGLASSADPEPRDPRAADRARFPCEEAHDINLFHHVEPLDKLTTHEIREIKRFVHHRGMRERELRLRVTLELFLGVAQALRDELAHLRALVGDAEEHVAIRHLELMGLDVHVIEGTRPTLPPNDLMHPMYVTREVVKPFVAWLPTGSKLVRSIQAIEQALAAPSVFAGADTVKAELVGTMRRIET